jgi:hypothetical protein
MKTFAPKDTYIKILVSNQAKSTSIIYNCGFEPTYNENLSYIVNSCYKPYGRSL